MHDRIKTFAVPLLALLVLVLMIMWLAGAFERKIEPGVAESPAAYKGKTFTVMSERVTLYESVPATVRSKQSTEVSARVLARIVRIPVRAGDSVNRGDLLVELDSRDLQAKVAQARENLNAVAARLRQAKLHFDRIQGLYQKQSATRADFEQASADHENLKAQRGSTVQMLREAEAALSHSRISADFPGRVIDRFVEPGDMAAPGVKLLTLYDPRSLRVDANIRETLALGLGLGQTLETRIPALNKTVAAVIEEIVPAADPGARSFLVKAHVEDSLRLLPGMFARLRIPAGEAEKILIPADYIRQVGQLDVVWVAGERGVTRRFIRAGKPWDEDRITVISGLAPGEELVAPEKAVREPPPLSR